MPRIAAALLASEYRKGKSLERIGVELRIPERTVASRLRAFGVTIRRQGRPRKGAAAEAALKEMANMRLTAKGGQMSTGPKFPDVTVALSGEDGNVFMIAGRVGKALKRAGNVKGAEEFYAALEKAPNYDAALQLVMRTVHAR